MDDPAFVCGLCLLGFALFGVAALISVSARKLQKLKQEQDQKQKDRLEGPDRKLWSIVYGEEWK